MNEIDSFIRASHSRQLDHSRARLDAIDRSARVQPNELGKKATIPLTHDEHATRRPDLAEEGEAGPLQSIPENERLEPAIMRRHPIETHRSEKGSASKGVSRTRSASAVRLSRARRGARFSLTSRSALAARQNQSGKAKRQKMAQTSAAKTMP